MNPDFNMGFSNTFSYKGINLGVVLTARVGGLCVSNTPVSYTHLIYYSSP